MKRKLKQSSSEVCGGRATHSAVSRRAVGAEEGKKAIFGMLSDIIGYHVAWVSVISRDIPAERKKSKDNWNPPDEELLQGVAYINGSNCPDEDGANEQTVWTLQKQIAR